MMGSFPNGWGWNDPSAIPPPGLYSQQRAGVPVTPHTVLQIGVVHRCLEVIVNSIIQMGNPQAYTLQQDKDNRNYRTYSPNQPAVLTNTWGLNNQTEGTTRTVASLGLFGEAFWYVLSRNYLQFPTALEVLNPLFLVVNQAEDGGPQYFYGTGVNRVELEREDVFHIQGLTMPGARRSLSTVEYESISFALALAALDYGSRWFAQGASPSFILTTEQRIGKDEVKRIAETFLVEHGGLQSAHLPLVVDSGLKVDRISSTPDEAQYLGTLEYVRQEIAGYFGIPSHLIGSTGDSNLWGKGLEEANFSLIDFTLSGYTARINEAYTNLLPRGTYAALDDRALARANSADRAHEVTSIRTATIMTPNEIRRDYYSLPPATGGDNLDAPLASNVAPPTDDEANPESPAPSSTPGGTSTASASPGETRGDTTTNIYNVFPEPADTSIHNHFHDDRKEAEIRVNPTINVLPPAVTVQPPNVVVEAAAPVVVPPSVVRVDVPSPVINVTNETPVINVEAPRAPIVRVAAPVVNVESPTLPDVHVTVAAPAKTNRRIERDKRGQIIRVVEEPDA